jgi:prepilin-type N-terminal cleavage/methylation domain-containing protein
MMNAQQPGHRWRRFRGFNPCHLRNLWPGLPQAGLTLIEVMAAVTISGLVAIAVVTSLRIGVRAWEKSQSAVMQLRKHTNAADVLHMQLADSIRRTVEVQLFDAKVRMPFFFCEEDRLVFLTAYSAAARGRGGLVVADYFAEQQGDKTYKLWLDERPALDERMLAEWVAGSESTPDAGDKIRLRPFDTGRAWLLWEGLSECRFQFLRQAPDSALEWVTPWPLFSVPYMPAALRLQLAADPAAGRGMAPVPVYARFAAVGDAR